MKQAVVRAPGAGIELREVALPACKDDQVLVAVAVATVCGQTDLAIMRGEHPPHDAAVDGMLPHDLRAIVGKVDGDVSAPYYPRRRFSGACFPAPMGHEAAGVIAALGPRARSEESAHTPPLAVGDRVATFKIRGGYAEYAALSARNVLRLPDSLSLDEGSLFEPLMINYNCLRRCWSIREPRTVLVLGQGCQGLISTQLARALGARTIIISEPTRRKRELGLELGADVAIDPRTTNLVDSVERVTDGAGADLVVECVGREETVRSLPFLVRRGGMVAQVGAITRAVKFDYGYVHFKHFIVVPSDYFRSLSEVSGQAAELLGHLTRKEVNLSRLVSHRFPLERIADAFHMLRTDPDAVVKIAIDIVHPGFRSW